MSKNEIIQSIFNDKQLYTLSLKYDVNGDLWSELMLYLCQVDEDYLQHMHDNNFLRYHVVSCITRSSLMYQNYTKFSNKITVTDECLDFTNDENYSEDFLVENTLVNTDEAANLANVLIELENTYDKEVFKIITKGVELPNGEFKKYKSVAELSRETGIKYTTLVNSYKRTINRLNERITYIISKGWRT